MNAETLLPCPFCGGEPELVREGTPRQSCIVACTDCGARLESPETFNSGSSWNSRATPPAGPVVMLRRSTSVGHAGYYMLDAEDETVLLGELIGPVSRPFADALGLAPGACQRFRLSPMTEREPRRVPPHRSGCGHDHEPELQPIPGFAFPPPGVAEAIKRHARQHEPPAEEGKDHG